MTDTPGRGPLVPSYTGDDAEVLEKTVEFQGFFRIERLRVRHKLFAGGWSQPLERELFVRGPAVGVLLYDPQADLVGVVEQFRIGALEEAAGPWCLEVVAGMVDAGESLLDVAQRELAEETGLSAEHWESICSYLPSPGGTNEKMHLFCACTSLEGAGGLFGLDTEHEDIRFAVLPAQEVLDGLYGDALNNAASIICLQWLALNRGRLRSAGQ
ncbi:NUDIX domain-containing protein [Biformimicrobium ophioploci]|uniref:ADP-ribose pyrophosphatase n=1 Tax=Biformimicrobium ophioploci TaxID=3036711 RepID=A0ABQ6M0T1_9GAMM|nr:NUDIX domain-containing protein [Microbulbifer sp. NKW57]GMG87892.1 NUDIX domain-containing protein [Microbulbifer sp. NKW57]